MDALSQVLRSLRLHGSIYAAWHLSAPWGLSFAAAPSAAFHLVESGSAWLIVDGLQRVKLETGDVSVLFCGKAHRICDAPSSRAEPIMSALRGRKGPALSHRYGGGGRQTHIICGRFTVDEREGTPALWRQLPPLLHLRRERFAELVAFSRTFDLLGQELRGGAPGADRAASLLTETLLIHVLRAVLAQADDAPIGWMAGLRDPQIGASLALIHAEPQKRWSLESLARRAGLSRAAFAKRFHEKVGMPPMAYLATWRLQLAARWLRETGLSISEILDRLGYGSAASFHRAFKGRYGLSPSAYRERQAALPAESVVRRA